MTNEEIRATIQQYQRELRGLIENQSSFELNTEISTYQNKIKKLRKQCTHLDTNHEKQVFNGRCMFCGEKLV